MAPIMQCHAAQVSNMSGRVRSRSARAAPRSLDDTLARNYLTNSQSAVKVQEVAASAQYSGAVGVDAFAKAGAGGNHPQNISRDLNKHLKHRTTCPEPYMVHIPITMPKLDVVSWVDHPVLLPSEMIKHMLDTKKINLKVMIDGLHNRMFVTHSTKVNQLCQEHHLSLERTIALGFHGDGVPYQKSTHKQATLDVLSWNILSEKQSKRYIFCALPKSYYCNCGCSGRHTLYKLLDVITWDLLNLFKGIHPDARHDGTPWDSQFDNYRAACSNKPYGLHAVLLEARGDWPWYSQVFAFPAHQAGSMCWRCRATTGGDNAYWLKGMAAGWRHARYEPGEYLSDLSASGKELCPLFSLPGFTSEQVCLGLLHVMDQGVLAYCLGNVLWESLDKLGFAHRQKAGRCALLWQKMQAFYKVYRVKYQLQGLTLKMIKQDGNPPKLRGKGMQLRSLVRFGVECAEEMHTIMPTPHSWLVVMAMRLLDQLYMCMRCGWCPMKACELSIGFSHCFFTLAEMHWGAPSKIWSVKPKLHLMEEMFQYQVLELGNPAEYQEYLDEDFVGKVAPLALRRGGPTRIMQMPGV